MSRKIDLVIEKLQITHEIRGMCKRQIPGITEEL